MWRTRTTPLEIVVVGSPAVGGTWADPGWRREARLTPGYGEVAAWRHQTEARRLWRSKVWRDATCYSKRFFGGTDPATATPEISPLLSPPQVSRIIVTILWCNDCSDFRFLFIRTRAKQ